MFDSRFSLHRLGQRMASTPIEHVWRPVDVAELRARVEAALLASPSASPRP